MMKPSWKWKIETEPSAAAAAKSNPYVAGAHETELTAKSNKQISSEKW